MAKLAIKAHPLVREETDSAFNYYLVRNPTAALNFMAELGEAERAIQRRPEAWPKYLWYTALSTKAISVRGRLPRQSRAH
jgi:hypothetical protein